jgi:hypothetical protein
VRDDVLGFVIVFSIFFLNKNVFSLDLLLVAMYKVKFLFIFLGFFFL